MSSELAELFVDKLCVCKNSSIYGCFITYVDLERRVVLTSFYLLSGQYLLFLVSLIFLEYLYGSL